VAEQDRHRQALLSRRSCARFRAEAKPGRDGRCDAAKR
jgi:hypothetical protein